MALAWGERKRLMRLSELAEEVLQATRMPRAEEGGIEAELDALTGEVKALLVDADARLAAEFERIVMRPEPDRPLDLRAASLAGWLRAEVQTENLDEARAIAGLSEEDAKRRLTIGFRTGTRAGSRGPDGGE
jgi:hypothetical protein